jgi:NAD(P)H-hydrate repair Nnr-like enzyme with NAD(P)H-hydrate dehydratase domain
LYWKKQTAEKPLYPDIEWSKPQQRNRAGRLGIIGGNKLGFAGVSEAYQTAIKTGIGSVRMLLPDALKKNIPSSMTDALFAPSNPSGGLSREATNQMIAMAEWASGILLIGDAGRNSETAILYEDFIKKYQGPLIVTRDALDLVLNSADVGYFVIRPTSKTVQSRLLSNCRHIQYAGHQSN